MSDGFSIPSDGVTGRSSDLVGELVLLRPLEDVEKDIDTSTGRSTARFCEALIVEGPNGAYRNLGETPIFWEIVRRQLREASPWLAGYVRKVEGGRAYRIHAPEPENYQMLRDVLARHNGPNRQDVESPEDDPDAGPDEAPF